MGCFLGCFGISSKRKRRKQPPRRILPGDSLQKLLSYESLDSSVSIDIPENPISSNSQLSDKPKERSSIKVIKKVSFNLNVQTYEPIPDAETTTYQFLQSVEEEEESGKNGADTGKGSLPSAVSERDSNSLQKGCSYPANYRYQNCRESYDEEDEMTYGESDLEDDLDDDDDYFYDYDDGDDGDKDDDQSQQRSEEFDKDKNKMPVDASKDGELKSLGCENARIRSQNLCSVLNPVENTTQWKEIKAKAAAAAAPPKHMRKENIALEEEQQIPFSSKLRSNCSPNYNQSKPLLQDISVDASLSNWLTPPNTDGCSNAFDMPSSKQSTWGSREDRVILDITNLEAL